MSRKSIEEILAGAARGEPMDIEERNRLAEALERSAWLRVARDAQAQLTADLAGLRDALQTLRAPSEQEHVLRSAFNARRASRRAPRPAPTRVAGIVSVLVVVAVLVVERVRQSSEQAPLDAPDTGFASSAAANRGDSPGRRAIEEPGVGVVGTFQPLMYAPGFSPTASYSVVRVRIPVSALAITSAADLDGLVEADILIGEDGLPTAIRFTRTDAVASTFAP